MLMLTMGWSISACAKGNNSSNNQTQNSGGNDKPQEIVLMSYNDIIDAGANLSKGFLDSFTENDNQDLVDTDIINKKEMFLDASEMMSKVKSFNNITYDMVLCGEKLEASDNLLLPEQVNKFSVHYSKDSTTAYSKVDIRMIFAYTALDVAYNYDFYNFVIETNQIAKTMRLVISLEKSTNLGSTDSSARYEVLELNADLNDLSDISSYKVFGYNRSRVLTSYAAKDIYNSINSFTKSEFNGTVKAYMNVDQGDVCLRNDSTTEFALIVNSVSNLGQCVKRLQMSKALKTISGFSAEMISCFGE